MNESRTKKIGRNLVFAIIFQVVKIALVFISRIIFVKELGVSYLGVNGLFSNILSILSLADLGMTTTMMYSLYKPLAEKDEKRIVQYVNYFRKVYNLIALTVAAIGVILIPFLQYLVNLPENMPYIYLYYILILMNSVISYLFVYKTTLLSADQKMYIINKYDTIFQFLLFFMQTLILLVFKNFALYLIVNVICTLLSNFAKAREVDKIYPYLRYENIEKLPNIEIKNIFENLYSLFFYKLGGIIQTNTDNILISIFVGTIAVGYYSNYSTIILSITTFLTIVFNALKASIGNFVVEKTKDEQYRIFNLLEIYNFWLVGFCSICLFLLIPDFIRLCFGKEYILNNEILVSAVLYFYIANIRQTIWTFRETTGIFKKTRFITIITSTLNLIISIIFGYYFGIVGIISATILSAMLYSWWKEPQILFRDYFQKSPFLYYAKHIFRFLLVFFICIITVFFSELFFIKNVYLRFIYKAAVCVIIPSMLFMLLYGKNEAINYLMNLRRK